MILVTGATGMFGGHIARGLLDNGQPVRALVRDPAKAADLEAKGAELAVGDMDQPDTLPPALEGVDRVFLVSPMDEQIEAREKAVIAAAREANVDWVVKLYGAVKHHGDALDALHRGSIEALKASGLQWALLSPNSVMETSLLSWAEVAKQAGTVFGSAGEGKVGLIAAKDAGDAGVALLAGDIDAGRDYQVTGPAAVTSAEMAAALSKVAGKEITYTDMSDDDLRDLLVKYADMTPEEADIRVILHYQAWRRGDADLVTDTVQELTGHAPQSLDDWFAEHADAFR
jgi:uncharacterized protein YbjT (DUF2867 family)